MLIGNNVYLDVLEGSRKSDLDDDAPPRWVAGGTAQLVCMSCVFTVGVAVDVEQIPSGAVECPRCGTILLVPER
jgi:hypothetical protein